MTNKVIEKIDRDIEFVKNAQFEQLGGNDYKELYRIKKDFDGHLQEGQFVNTILVKLRTAVEICDKLLLNATVWKVAYRVMKGRDGCYENGGESYFWTEDKAEDFIIDFKKHTDGWTSAIDEPEEIDLMEVDAEDVQ